MKRSMARGIGLVAKREFVTTVASKGFLIGLLIMPTLALITDRARAQDHGFARTAGGRRRGDHRSHGPSRLAELGATLEPAAMDGAGGSQHAQRASRSASRFRSLTLIERPASADRSGRRKPGCWRADRLRSVTSH